MKKIVFFFLLFGVAVGHTFSLGCLMPDFKIQDQFGKEQSIAADIKVVLFAANKEMNAILVAYLQSKQKDFLEKNKACYVADISKMPSLIAKIFALPKMRKYAFSVLLLNEEQAEFFDKKENFITAYCLKNGKILAIQYVKTAGELDSIFYLLKKRQKIIRNNK